MKCRKCLFAFLMAVAIDQAWAVSAARDGQVVTEVALALDEIERAKDVNAKADAGMKLLAIRPTDSQKQLIVLVLGPRIKGLVQRSIETQNLDILAFCHDLGRYAKPFIGDLVKVRDTSQGRTYMLSAGLSVQFVAGLVIERITEDESTGRSITDGR